jgi:hypothetical protein
VDAELSVGNFAADRLDPEQDRAGAIRVAAAVLDAD